MLPSTRKRILLEPTGPLGKSKRSREVALKPTVRVQGECGRLLTVDVHKGKRALMVQLSSVFWIGRSPVCDYIMEQPSVSMKHCRIYAFVADTGETVVCLEDLSSNGTMHNERKVSKGTVVLCDGDRLEIGGQVFRWSQPGRQVNASHESAPVAKEKIGNYIVFNRLLGSGAFSVVHLAFNTKTLTQVACKKITRKKMIKESLMSVQREVEILKTVSHPNINKVEDVVVSELDVAIFLQLVSGGDLFGYLIKKGTLGAPETKWILFQILQGLDYLHSQKNIAHRDLKLENVILAGHGPFPKALLADFGQARFATQDFSSLKGTITYMAPEQLTYWTRRGGYDGKRADCWSVGIILVMLLAGNHPFEDWITESQIELESLSPSIFGSAAQEDFQDNPKDMRTCRAVVEGDLMLPGARFGSDDHEVRTLIRHLLAPNPKERCTTREALDSHWIRKSQGELLELYEKIVTLS